MNALQICPWQFSQMCYGWGATSEKNRKSAISHQRGHFDPKLQVQGVASPTNNLCTIS